MKTSPRILVAECMQEISSFNPLPSGYENFRVERGDEMLVHQGLNTALGGALAEFKETGLEPVLTIGARAGSRSWSATTRRWPISKGSRRSDGPISAGMHITCTCCESMPRGPARTATATPRR